jgi:hypothetical protein
MEIRSYRRVFDLERRIYRIDQLRLNPSGIPVRAVVYFLAIVAIAIAATRAPVIAAAAAPVPWYVRDLVAPALLAWLLAAVRIDGRPFHVAAHAFVARWDTPHGIATVRRRDPVDAWLRWRPPPLLMLADGSDHRLRSVNYRGPGAARVTACHAYNANERGVARRLRRHPIVLVRSARAQDTGVCAQVIVLGRRAEVRIRG